MQYNLLSKEGRVNTLTPPDPPLDLPLPLFIYTKSNISHILTITVATSLRISKQS